jgi:outer membrane protein, adhesin transport system
MSRLKAFSSQFFCVLGGCEHRVRWLALRGTAVAIVRSFRLLAIAASPLLLASCVTTATVPNSPFLTAVARANPFATKPNAAVADAPPSVMDANAAALDNITTASLRPSATAPGPSLPARGASPAAVGPTVAGVPINSVALPSTERKQVYPQIASASTDVAGLFAPAAASAAAATSSARGDITGSIGHGGRPGLSLRDAVGAAVMSHPLMGAQAARVTGSLADVRAARGATLPQLQVYGGSGGAYLGGYVNNPSPFGTVDIPGSSRSDAGFTLRQLVYDFGAAKADIARTKSVVDAERLRLADEAEDIALRTVNAYVNLLEQQQLIAEIDKVVADDNNFENLIKMNEKQGNGTAADVNRIRSKVIEVEALRTDITTSLETAQDEFFRLTKLDSKRVSRPASLMSAVPPTFDAAFATAKQFNPSLLALNATGISFQHQLASNEASRLPRVDIQGDGLVKHYVGSTAAASPGIVDSRVMLMVSYKLLDGGLGAAQSDRIREDKRANDFRTLDEKESIELNLKRFYQALSANRIKENAAVQGVSTAQKAYSLYMEQFKAGKRTVFEVLDSRMVVFTMYKNSINAKYEQLRASYGILRNMGRLVETAARL